MSAAIAERLRSAAARVGEERISMQHLLQAHGSAATGSLLLLLTVPCLLPLPGTGTAFGLALLALGLCLLRRDEPLQLPERLLSLSLPGAAARRVLLSLATVYDWAGRCLQERLQSVQQGLSRRLLGPLVLAMGGVLILPIPLTNIPPGLALVAIGLGLVFRDGLFLLLGKLLAFGTLGGLAWAGHWLLA